MSWYKIVMEMNIFLAQSNQTKIELEEMADVQRQIITPALSVPIIGIVQDGLLGAYNLTQQNMKVDWKSAMNIISYTSLDDFSSFKKEGDIAGADLFSLIIPSRINNSGNLEIKNGKIIKGALNKAALGAKKAHSLIHLIWDEYGFERTRQFIDDTQRLINNFNLWDGVSVGFGDLNIPEQVTKQLHELFETNKLEVDHMNTEIENYPDLIDPEILEQTISAQLGAVRDNASKIVMNNLKFDNNFNIMITSGSKGDASNMGQMVACLGQQMVEGKRIQPKFNGRALPYFAQGDNSALGRGFVQQPFMRGSHPVGFIFHNMASREGLIDTAIKTAESGYIQRKLVKSMEDLSVKYDGTVRNANNTIVQFIYGDNGVDTTRQSIQFFKMLEMSNAEIATKVKFNDQEIKNFKNFSEKKNNEFYNELLRMRNAIRESRTKTAINNITFDSSFMLPVNIRTVINNIKDTDLKGDKLEPEYCLNRIDEILDYENTKNTSFGKEYQNKDSFKYKDEMLSKIAFKFSLYEFLAPKICIFEYGLNKEKFDKVCSIVMETYNKSIIEPGEMCGVIAAQSIGEPTTQIVRP